MAKKAVATLRKGGGTKGYAKVIKMVKSPKTDSYQFKEDIIPQEEVKNFFNKK